MDTNPKKGIPNEEETQRSPSTEKVWKMSASMIGELSARNIGKDVLEALIREGLYRARIDSLVIDVHGDTLVGSFNIAVFGGNLSDGPRGFVEDLVRVLQSEAHGSLVGVSVGFSPSEARSQTSSWHEGQSVTTKYDDSELRLQLHRIVRNLEQTKGILVAHKIPKSLRLPEESRGERGSNEE